MTFSTITNSIMGANANGLLIDLQLHRFFPADQAIMYYNYIGIFAIVIWAAFAGQSNESRYTFTTPFFAALMVYIGWLKAPDPTTYWGTVIFCMLLRALMYINDMNHEKSGVAGPGDKIFSIAFLIMCFTASMGFVSSSEFGFFSDQNMGTTQNNKYCNVAYQCDSSGNIMLDASVTQVSSSGGLMGDVISAIAALPAIALGIIKLLILVLGSVVFFSAVMMAAYPVLMSSPQVIVFMIAMNVVIWGIYAAAFYQIFSGRPTGGNI